MNMQWINVWHKKRPELSTADSDHKLHTGSQQVAAGKEKEKVENVIQHEQQLQADREQAQCLLEHCHSRYLHGKP